MLYEFTKIRVGKKSIFTHPDVGGIKFCIRALSKHKDEKRNHVIRLYVKDGFMVATDGSRLHQYELESEMPDGFYRPLINTKTHLIIYHEKDNGADYPEYQDILNIPDDVEPIKLLGFGKDHIFTSYAKTIKHANGNLPLNFDFCKDLGGDDFDDFFDLYLIKENSFLFKGGRKTALLMGMHI